MIFNVRQSYGARYLYRLDVCLPVRLSVRHTLVLCQNGCSLSSNCLHCLEPHDSSFQRTNLFSRNSNENTPRGVPRRTKCAKNVLKWRNFELTGWITGKCLKIDGYILRCVWQALNHLFIHVTFTAIVPGCTQERPKCAFDSLEVAKCLHPQNWRRQQLTGVILLKSVSYTHLTLPTIYSV